MKKLSPILLAIAVVFTGLASAQDVIKYDGDSDNLTDRWKWAERHMDRGQEAWIGYSIERLMHENSHMGRYSSRKSYPTFGELLYGVRTERVRGVKHSDRKVLKEMVMLFHFNPTGAIDDITFATLDSDAYIEDDIYWLGAADTDASLMKVDEVMRRTGNGDVREDLVAAIAMHDNDDATQMLRGILKGDDSSDVREQAAFWMSQLSDADEILNDLVSAARSDRSEDVQEQAVFAVSQIDTDRATDALIELATKGPHEIRDESIFWLGQKATDKATESLADIVEDDPSIEVKKQALFALSQQKSGDSIGMLIEIANTHSSKELRKEAIFWLSQSDDPAALDAIVELVRG